MKISDGEYCGAFGLWIIPEDIPEAINLGILVATAHSKSVQATIMLGQRLRSIGAVVDEKETNAVFFPLACILIGPAPKKRES